MCGKRDPTPTVTWYHNGGNPRGMISVNRNINTLTISSSVVGDTGMYQRIADNGVGKVQVSWAMQVRTPGEGIMYTHMQVHVLAIVVPSLFPTIHANTWIE